jgi:hypothetical protein
MVTSKCPWGHDCRIRILERYRKVPRQSDTHAGPTKPSAKLPDPYCDPVGIPSYHTAYISLVARDPR